MGHVKTSPEEMAGGIGPPQDSTRRALVVTPKDHLQVQGAKLPIEDGLREYFARLHEVTGSSESRKHKEQAIVEGQIVELSNQAVSLFLAASAEAGALRQLAEECSPTETKNLDLYQ